MQVSDFDYKLPEERIAQRPPKVRGASRLLVLDRSSGELVDQSYEDLVEHLNEGDVLVLNNTKVLPARLQAIGEDGKTHELLLLELHTSSYGKDADCLYRGKLQSGEKLSVGTTEITIEKI